MRMCSASWKYGREMPDGASIFERFLDEMTLLLDALAERLDEVENTPEEEARLSSLRDVARLSRAVMDLAGAFEAPDLASLGEALAQASSSGVSAGAPIPVAVFGARDTLSYLRWRLGEIQRAGAVVAPGQRALSLTRALVAALTGEVAGREDAVPDVSAGDEPSDNALSDNALSEFSPDEREIVRSFATAELRPRDEMVDTRTIGQIPETLAREFEQWALAYSDVEDVKNDERLVETKRLFVLETENDLQELSRLIASYGQEPEARTLFQAMSHIAHKIKGTAGTLGFPEFAQLAFYFEAWTMFALQHGGAASEGVIRVTLGRFLELFHACLAAAVALESPDPAVVQEARQLYDFAAQPTDSPSHAPDVISAAPATEAAARLSPAHTADGEQAVGREILLQVDSTRLDALMIHLNALAVNRGSLAAALAHVSQAQRDLSATLDRLHEKSGQIIDAHSLNRRERSPESDPTRRHFAQDDDQSLQPNRSVFSGQLRESWREAEQEEATEIDTAIRALTEVVSDVEMLGATLSGALMRMGQLVETQEIVITNIQQDAARMRLAPLAELAPRLEILANYLASAFGKRVRFTIEGEMTEIDRSLMRALAEPLNQIVRNAITHGIESPEERLAAGKPETGAVWIHAYYAGSEVIIEVGDDGRGVDTQALLTRAISNGALDKDEADTLSAEDKLNLMFRPGVTTFGRAGALAGSGIGLHEVATLIRAFKGDIVVADTSSQGTLFRIRAPMTLTVLPALEISVAGRLFTTPFSSVVASYADVAGNLRPISGDQLSDGKEDGLSAPTPHRFIVPDETASRLTEGAHATPPLRPGSEIPAYSLAECLGLASDEPPGAAFVVESRQRYVALLVHAFGAMRETMVRPLPAYLQRKLIRGVTIRSEDGALTMLIDASELAEQLLAGAIRPPHFTPTRVPRSQPPVSRVLIVDDSVTIRRALDQMLTGAGFSTALARDGYEAWEMMEAEAPRAVILDVEMPHMDGYELLKTMRRSPRYAQTRVIVLTSRAGARHERQARELGADEYLVKPCPQDTLISAIRRLLTDSEPS